MMSHPSIQSMDNFNLRRTGEYENETVTRYANANSEMVNFRQIFGEEFNRRLKAVGWDISKVTDVALPELPNFDEKFSGLGATIHGTQQADIYLTKFTYNRVLGYYFAEFRLEIRDDFGLSNADVLVLQNSWHIVPDIAGLKAWWILQHRRNYQPFVTKVTSTFRIKGTLK